MAREEVTFTKYTCDRCGRSASAEGWPHMANAWCKISFQTVNGGAIAGRYKLEDVCDQCTESFEEWVKNA